MVRLEPVAAVAGDFYQVIGVELASPPVVGLAVDGDVAGVLTQEPLGLAAGLDHFRDLQELAQRDVVGFQIDFFWHDYPSLCLEYYFLIIQFLGGKNNFKSD